MLSNEQKQKYIKTGSHCPYCGSEDIEATMRPKADEGWAWQDIACNHCRKQWRDIYTLSDIKEFKE